MHNPPDEQTVAGIEAELSALLREPDRQRPLESLETLVVLAALRRKGLDPGNRPMHEYPDTVRGWARWAAGRAAPAKDLLLYVQVPFCPSKCHFCGWVSDVPVRDLRLRETDSPRAAYLEAVRRQIRHWAPRLAAGGYRPKVMYWGGGTASILSPDEFRGIMATLREEFDLSGLTEATVESSPDTLTPDKLRAYREEGFGRVSIGVQSFDDARLATEGRSHRSDQARRAVRMVRESGIDKVNVDLMCGLPGERIGEFHGSARALLELPVTHISLYPYAPVPGTVMFRQLQRGDGALDRRERLVAFRLGQRLFTEAGFPEYSMGYFGQEPCQADLAYYGLHMDYIGFGSGANSLLGGRSMTTHKALAKYTAEPLTMAVDEPAARTAPRFLIYQCLTMFDGVDARRWEERIGIPLEQVLADGPVAGWLDHLRRTAGLVVDDRGVRLPRDKIVPAYLDFLWAQAPKPDAVAAS